VWTEKTAQGRRDKNTARNEMRAEGIAVKEIVIEPMESQSTLFMHIASRRAAKVAYELAKRYCSADSTVRDLENASEGNERLPKSFIVGISQCYDFKAVLGELEREIEEIQDGFAEPLATPVISADMVKAIVEGTDMDSPVVAVVNSLQKAFSHGYFIGRSDAGHEIQDDVACAPYAGHTAKEMVALLQSIYTEAKGDERRFSMRIQDSPDPRLHRMSRMAIEIFFAFLSRQVTHHQTDWHEKDHNEESYLLNIAAEKSGLMHSGTRICVAKSKQQAVAVGVRFAYQQWPVEDGYINHQSTSVSLRSASSAFIESNKHLDFGLCHCGNILFVCEKEDGVDTRRKALGVMVEQMRSTGYALAEVCGEYKIQTGDWDICPLTRSDNQLADEA
jgi:hypothetical protein